MTIVIEWGWWLLPLAITIGAFGWSFYELKDSDDGSGGYYGDIGTGFVGLLLYGASTVVSLFAWLIYFIIN